MDWLLAPLAEFLNWLQATCATETVKWHISKALDRIHEITKVQGHARGLRNDNREDEVLLIEQSWKNHKLVEQQDSCIDDAVRLIEGQKREISHLKQQLAELQGELVVLRLQLRRRSS